MKSSVISILVAVLFLLACRSEEEKKEINTPGTQVGNYLNSKYLSEVEIEQLFSEGINIPSLEQRLQGKGLFLNFETEESNGIIDLFAEINRPFILNMFGTYEIINTDYSVYGRVLFLSILIKKEILNDKIVTNLNFQITSNTLISLLKKYFHSYKYAPELVDAYQIQSIELIKGNEERVDN